MRLNVKLITFLVGITLPRYWTLLRNNPGSIELRYWPRALMIFVLSIVNSIFESCENKKQAKQAKTTSTLETPIFILGHWGSGTTYLHKLISSDPQFIYPTLYQVTYPSTYLCTQRAMLALFKQFFPAKRHWDQSKIDPLMPMEDELALAVLSLKSPYLGWVFPKQEQYYDRYLTFDDVEMEEVNKWKQALTCFTDKIRGVDQRNVVFKSPTHTAKIKTILSCYPNAKFIHIHRHPIDLYEATIRLYENALPHFCLQRRDYQNLRESILVRYQSMYNAYFKDIRQLSNHQHCEVAFEKLVQDPHGQLKFIYQALSLTGYDEAQSHITKFIKSVSDYQEPCSTPLSSETITLIEQNWSRFYSQWGYEISQ